MTRVILINMPFRSLRWPAIGISLLKASLARRKIACDIAYFDFDFAEAIGLDLYEWVDSAFGFVLGGDRIFAKLLFPGQLPSDEAYDREVLLPTDSGVSRDDLAAYHRIAHHAGPFLDRCFAHVDWSRYAVAGFTTTFQQTLASLALARRVKQHHPRIRIVFGGANCEGCMGDELRRQFPFIDDVFSGEADESFPAFVTAMADTTATLPETEVCGGTRRSAGTARQAGSTHSADPAKPPSIARDLDALPYPDYSDYFRRLAASPLAPHIDPLLLFETSRGCWWGAKHHCSFCGLNGRALGFRSKTPQRAVTELLQLADTYGVHRACATDNIMDFRYFDSFLPKLADANAGVDLEYELKTNLSRRNIEALVSAGLRAAQLGIETFSSSILKIMRKGVSAVQNLQTLKWLTAAGVETKWNFLYGFPGENPAEYDRLATLFASLSHLAPPQVGGPVRIDRFSPYFEAPEAFGLPAPTPIAAYRFIYPFGQDALGRLAYYFQAGCTGGGSTPAYVRPALEALDTWRADFPLGTMQQSTTPEGALMILDTRPRAARFQWRLTGVERAIYLACDTGQTIAAIERLCRSQPGQPTIPSSQIHEWLDRWIAHRIMVRVDHRYLSLALG